MGGTGGQLRPRVTLRRDPADGSWRTFGHGYTYDRSAARLLPSGLVPLFLRGVAIEGADAADFEIGGNGCDGLVLVTGRSCFVGVRFTPWVDGPRTASLVLSAPLLAGDRHVVELRGTGVAAPAPPAPAPPPASQPAPSGAPPATGPPARSAGRATAAPRLRCAARRGRAVVCRGVPRSFGSGRVRVSRNGIVHATDRLADGRLTLTVRRRLYDRRYTLVVGGRRPGKVVLD